MSFLFCDATFRKVDDKAVYGFAVWNDNLLVLVGYICGPCISSAKEAVARDIFSALKVVRSCNLATD